MTTDEKLVLSALHGSSLLGYLAAIGVSRLTSFRLAWRKSGPTWLATLETTDELCDIADLLLERCLTNPLDGYEKALKLTLDEWLSLPPEWAAAVGSEDGDGFVPAPIFAIRGGSHQYPVTTIDKINAELTIEDITSALVGPWLRKPKYGMRWGPTEWKRHADQWVDPSSEDTMVARGPTRLAVEALPLVPTLTPDWAAMSSDRKHRIWRWPIWTEWLSPASIRGRIQSGCGVTTFTCERHHTGQAQYSFTPSRPLSGS